MSRKIAVVVPFYQEQPGLLKEAVLSAASQVEVSRLDIIVVDDGSPIPARRELKDVVLPRHVALRILEQRNRGPGAARNKALEHISADTAYAAFLDSDDRWTDKHLRNAQFILDAGYDFYFGNAWSLKYDDEFLRMAGMKLEDHVCIDVKSRMYRFTGQFQLHLMKSQNFFHTSTVVFRYEKFPAIRFPEISCMGEDLTFWMDLGRMSSGVGFCLQIDCISGGPGVHIFRDSGWGSARAIWRLYEYMKWRKWLNDSGRLNAAERAYNAQEIRKLRSNFVAAMLHEMRRLRIASGRDMLKFILYDPAIIMYFFPLAVRSVMRRAGIWR